MRDPLRQLLGEVWCERPMSPRSSKCVPSVAERPVEDQSLGVARVIHSHLKKTKGHRTIM